MSAQCATRTFLLQSMEVAEGKKNWTIFEKFLNLENTLNLRFGFPRVKRHFSYEGNEQELMTPGNTFQYVFPSEDLGSQSRRLSGRQISVPKTSSQREDPSWTPLVLHSRSIGARCWKRSCADHSMYSTFLTDSSGSVLFRRSALLKRKHLCFSQARTYKAS